MPKVYVNFTPVINYNTIDMGFALHYTGSFISDLPQRMKKF